MHIKRAQSFPEWNFNTLVQVVGLLVIFSGGLFAYFSTASKAEHAAAAALENKTQAVAIATNVATTAAALDDRLDDSESMIARLSDRISASEARSAELSASMRELQKAVNETAGDVKVILAWIEEQRLSDMRANRDGSTNR
jgi:septal ring factor EnvC (AmiA/AmiB activator)